MILLKWEEENASDLWYSNSGERLSSQIKSRNPHEHRPGFKCPAIQWDERNTDTPWLNHRSCFLNSPDNIKTTLEAERIEKKWRNRRKSRDLLSKNTFLVQQLSFLLSSYGETFFKNQQLMFTNKKAWMSQIPIHSSHCFYELWGRPTRLCLYHRARATSCPKSQDPAGIKLF